MRWMSLAVLMLTAERGTPCKVSSLWFKCRQVDLSNPPFMQLSDCTFNTVKASCHFVRCSEVSEISACVDARRPCVRGPGPEMAITSHVPHTFLPSVRGTECLSPILIYKGEITISSKTLPTMQNHTMTYNIILSLFTISSILKCQFLNHTQPL